MRGELQFLISVIYSAIILLAIFFVFQAFVQSAAPKEKGLEQLETIDRVFETGYREAVFVSLQNTEKIFIGFPIEEHGCLEHYKTVVGTDSTDLCGDSLCYCYSFDPGDGPGRPYLTCKKRYLNPNTVFHGAAPAEAKCILAEGTLYHFKHDRDIDPPSIWFRNTPPPQRPSP